ncbi:glutathione S-transferase [Thalassotalea insulae]|uniref:Glutathione S-transferase n=1 Tax=Thalassotalea insulae TaxID=2056778 RepID=A0ABQ6GTC5_9GAMM|nr:glutathione S-transferase family protein [Thalassotalea insulae]GLX78589.1 glutathione S-transferase [Thalassotalea insulae]
MSRILYSGNRNASSWAFRAWLALKEQSIEFTEKIIDIRRPQRWKNLESIGEFSAPAAVPVLNDNGFIVSDSLAIMEYANELGDGSLLPINIQARARARSLAAWQHSTFGRLCSCLSFESAFYPEKKTLSADEVATIKRIYDIWEQSITEFGGDYLVGEYSLADIAFVPSVLRLTSHYQPDQRWPKTSDWVQLLLNRPYVKEWLNDANKLAPIYLPGYRNDP